MISAETEVLTESGFKRAIDLSVVDKVATVDLKTDKLLFDQPRAINRSEVSFYSVLNSNGHNERVSDKHMLVINNKLVPLEKAREDGWGNTKDTVKSKPPGVDKLSPTRLRLVPWLLWRAEVKLGQLPIWGSAEWKEEEMWGPHVAHIRHLLTEADIEYVDGEYSIKVSGKDFETLTAIMEKRYNIGDKVYYEPLSLPESFVNLSPKQVDIFLPELLSAVGDKLTTQNWLCIDILQIMLFRNGYLSKKYTDPLGANIEVYTLEYRAEDKNEECNTVVADEKLRGIGVSIKTDQKTIVTRYNGIMQVTGGV